MTIEDLIACGERLERPCLHLVEASHGADAVWGGKHRDLNDSFDLILSLHPGLFEKIGLKVSRSFALVTWKDSEGDESGRAQPVKSDHWKGVVGGEPLTWRESKSFPPFPALCLYGGEPIETWLREMGLSPWEYQKIEPEWEQGYNAAYQARTPLYSAQNVYAQLGGLHALWPDDDYYLPREMKLLIWTFKDAEPWYEVFQTQTGNIVLKERIT